MHTSQSTKWNMFVDWLQLDASWKEERPEP
jgi:hypothetical protein